MNDRAVLLAPIVRRKAEALGRAGEAWLVGLPDLIADLERRWSVTVEQPLDGGTSAYVARARTGDGLEVVMKLGVPDPQFADEVGTIARARGRGYVRLLAHDVERHAMMLEALGPSMDRLDLAPETQIETLCRLLRQAWEVPRAVTGRFASALDKASGLHQLVSRLWEDLDRPCSEQVLAQALLFARRRASAFDPDRCVVVHGDAAAGNALQVLAPRRARRPVSSLSTRTGSSATPRTTLASPCATGARNCSQAMTHTPSPGGTAACWPRAAESTSKRSGNGASSSGCPPACT